MLTELSVGDIKTLVLGVFFGRHKNVWKQNGALLLRYRRRRGRDSCGKKIRGHGQEAWPLVFPCPELFQRLDSIREALEPDGFEVVHRLCELYFDFTRCVVGDHPLNQVVEFGSSTFAVRHQILTSSAEGFNDAHGCSICSSSSHGRLL